MDIGKELERIKVEPQPLQREVFLWGDVVRHERGFRAQYAKPAAFYADDLDFPLVRVNFD